jgi:hypothetical protein
MISILEFTIIRGLCIAVARMGIHVPFQRSAVGRTAVFLLPASVWEIFFPLQLYSHNETQPNFYRLFRLVANQMAYFASSLTR